MAVGLAYGGLPVTLNTVIDAPFKPLNQNPRKIKETGHAKNALNLKIPNCEKEMIERKLIREKSMILYSLTLYQVMI